MLTQAHDRIRFASGISAVHVIYRHNNSFLVYDSPFNRLATYSRTSRVLPLAHEGKTEIS